MSEKSRSTPTAAESWTIRAEDAAVAHLTIPGALNRTRIFDIDVQLVVRVDAVAPAPELGLRLEIDGAMQWSRTIAACGAGQTDSLDYHCRLVVESGRDVRLRARAVHKQARVLSLTISAAEDPG